MPNSNSCGHLLYRRKQGGGAIELVSFVTIVLVRAWCAPVRSTSHAAFFHISGSGGKLSEKSDQGLLTNLHSAAIIG